MDAKAFAARLKQLRETAGLTQRQLAEAIGSTVRNVSRLETGAQEATWPAVLKLSQALGVDCTAFTQEPAEREPAGRGRPRKAEAEPAADVTQAEGEKATGEPKGKRSGKGKAEGSAEGKKRARGKRKE